MVTRLVLASCHSPDFPELLLNARPKKNLSAEEAQNCNLVTKVVLLSLNTPLEAIQFLVATSEDKMSVGYLEPAGNNRKKRGDSYANKRHPMTLSKALGIFGHEQWSSLDKGKKSPFLEGYKNIRNPDDFLKDFPKIFLHSPIILSGFRTSDF